MKDSNTNIFTKGLIKSNPLLVLALGMCPALATTTSAINGLGMGLATWFVLLCSNITVSLLKNTIPEKAKLPAHLIIIANFVTIAEILIQAYWPELHDNLGIYIPLIVMNCLILGRAEVFASGHSVFKSALDALGMGLGFTLALTLLGVIREFLGTGKTFGNIVFPGEYGALLFVLAPGAFITLGFLIAGTNKLKKQS